MKKNETVTFILLIVLVFSARASAAVDFSKLKAGLHVVKLQAADHEADWVTYFNEETTKWLQLTRDQNYFYLLQSKSDGIHLVQTDLGGKMQWEAETAIGSSTDYLLDSTLSINSADGVGIMLPNYEANRWIYTLYDVNGALIEQKEGDPGEEIVYYRELKYDLQNRAFMVFEYCNKIKTECRQNLVSIDSDGDVLFNIEAAKDYYGKLYLDQEQNLYLFTYGEESDVPGYRVTRLDETGSIQWQTWLPLVKGIVFYYPALYTMIIFGAENDELIHLAGMGSCTSPGDCDDPENGFLFTADLNRDGEIVSSHNITLSNAMDVYDLLADEDGNLYTVSAVFDDDLLAKEMSISKYDGADGKELWIWEKQPIDQYSDYQISNYAIWRNKLYLSGYVEESQGVSSQIKPILSVYNENGILEWETIFPTSSQLSSWAGQMSFDLLENIYLELILADFSEPADDDNDDNASADDSDDDQGCGC